MEISKRLPIFFKKRGMEVYVDIRAKEIVKEGDKLKVIAKFKNKDEEIEVYGDKVLIASGRSPLVEGLNLEDVGVKYDEIGIHVDKDFMTSVEGIYAIGDVNNVGIQLAHVASAQGVYVMEKIMGLEPDINLDVYPNCVFTFPEVAYVGKTEEQLNKSGIDYKVSKFMFAANGKALAEGETAGFVKIISDNEYGEIIGVHIMAPHATDMIAEAVASMQLEGTVYDLAKTIHPHPTISEAVFEAALGAIDRPINI